MVNKVMQIRAFLKRDARAVEDICATLSGKTRFEIKSPISSLSLRNTEGFVGIEDRAVQGFAAVVFQLTSAYIFGVRIHPSAGYSKVLRGLMNFVSRRALKRGYRDLRSMYVIDNDAYGNVMTGLGWQPKGIFLLVQKRNVTLTPTGNVLVEFAGENDMDCLLKFIQSHRSKGVYQRFIFDKLVLYPLDATYIFKKFVKSRRVLVSRTPVTKNIEGAVIIDEKSCEQKVVILNSWGQTDACIEFVMDVYNPAVVDWFIGQEDEERARSLGFSALMNFSETDEKLYESRFLIIENLIR
jgi:hypothetical protein